MKRHTFYYVFVNLKKCIAIRITMGYNIDTDRKVVHTMATKSSNVMARVEPDIKREAEDILEQLGLPVSVLINSLYRQIIMKRGIPFSMTVPSKVITRDEMTDKEFDSMMEKGLAQAKAGEGIDLDSAFDELRRTI